MGITLATFRRSGYTPVCIERLTSFTSAGARIEEDSLTLYGANHYNILQKKFCNIFLAHFGLIKRFFTFVFQKTQK